MSTPKVSQSFTPNAHQVLLLEAPPVGGRATTPMVLAIDPIPHCRYLWTRVPPLAVSRLVWLSVTTPKGAEQPDPWGPTPSHRTSGPGPASRSGAGPVSPRVLEKGALSQNSRGGPGPPTGSRTPIHYLDPLAGREQTPRLRGSGAATCPQVRERAQLPSFLRKTCSPTTFSVGCQTVLLVTRYQGA